MADRDLNWVEAHFTCQTAQVFEELKLGVKDDIKTINTKRQLTDDAAFNTASNSSGSVFMVRRGQSTEVVKFSYDRNHIQIDDEIGHHTHSITLTLNSEGRCKLKVRDEELEQREVREMALEGLFRLKLKEQ